jgi:lipopolysaccharide export system protein LptA
VDRKTKKIKIYSKVVAKGQNGLTLTASTLVWNPKNELIATEGKFTLQKEGLKIEGKALKMNPKMEKVEVKEFSQDKPIKIKATTLIWNRAEEITILKDKVVILHEEKRLIADEVKAFGPFEAPTKFIGKGRIKLSDQKRKLTITSGYVEYDREKEYALFKENPMIIKEGERSFRIHCGFLECFFRENRVDAKENVIIHYLDITTESDFATYDQGKLILYGNPKLKRKNGTFSGERIIVYLEEDRVEIIGKVKGTLLFPQEK